MLIVAAGPAQHNGTIQVITRRFLLGHGVAVSFLAPAIAAPLSPRAAARPQTPPRVQPLVLLDPGHGGKDPGAIGVSGTSEKIIALDAAQELRRQLLASGRYRVELTRTRDVFIPLEDRVGIAQKHGAALTALGVDFDNGIGDLVEKLAKLPEAQRAAIEADLKAAYAAGPGVASVIRRYLAKKSPASLRPAYN